jgi:hypothetical protein
MGNSSGKTILLMRKDLSIHQYGLRRSSLCFFRGALSVNYRHFTRDHNRCHTHQGGIRSCSLVSKAWIFNEFTSPLRNPQVRHILSRWNELQVLSSDRKKAREEELVLALGCTRNRAGRCGGSNPPGLLAQQDELASTRSGALLPSLPGMRDQAAI